MSQSASNASGPSKTYDILPYAGYRELPEWFGEFVDAFGIQLDILYQRFITADSRANLLDPTFTPVDPVEGNLATATAAPTKAAFQDTMLDVLAYIALGQYPLDSNLTVAQKQALVAIGWEAIRRKGTREALLRLMAAMSADVVYGWTSPPFNFSLILSDGAPDPGFGAWCPVVLTPAGTVATTSGNPTVTGTATAFTSDWVGYTIIIGANSYSVSAVGTTTSLTLSANAAATVSGVPFYIVPGCNSRPWIFQAARDILGRFFPAWSNMGVGYSQFRAGYSGAGESVLPSGSTLSLLANSNFDTWSSGNPSSWNSTTATQSSTASEINYEFTSFALQFDQTAAAAGVTKSAYQTGTWNNQLDHRVEIDYAYTNSQLVSTLTLQITDVTNSVYWNTETEEWQSTAYFIALPVTSGRERYSIVVPPLDAADDAVTLGSTSFTVKVQTVSDGTSTTKVVYTVYRIAVLPMFSADVEEEAGGERLSWFPLIDALGHTLAVPGAGGADIVEPAVADRSSYKLTTGDDAYPYHPALTGRGLQCRSNMWTNLLKGSNEFITNWTLTDSFSTDDAAISPQIGETVATATVLSAISVQPEIKQTTTIIPTSKSYVAGVWVKKLSADSVFTDVTLFLTSTTNKTAAFTVTQAQGWTLLPIRATFDGSDLAALKFKMRWSVGGPSSGDLAVASAYMYDVTGMEGCLYPPVCQTPVGATATCQESAVKVVTSTQDADVLDPYLKRSLASVSQGLAQFTVVPTFDGTSQPDSVLLDIGQSTTQNRVYVQISSGALKAKLVDNSGTVSTASLTLIDTDDPTSSQTTWNRDTAITIRVRWQSNGLIQLSAGSSSAASTVPVSWAMVETGVALYRIGCDIADANFFDGLIRDLDIVNCGSPAT